MDFVFEKRSVILSRENLIHQLNKIIEILIKNNIISAEILFGFAWGLNYLNWTPFLVNVFEIKKEIEKAEKLEVGSIGRDDFYIKLSYLETEILICHECDIHLFYNSSNIIVENIINGWNASSIIQVVSNI